MKDSVGKKQMIMTSLIMLKHKLEKFSKVINACFELGNGRNRIIIILLTPKTVSKQL